MMNKLFKAALVVAAITGFQAMGTAPASAAGPDLLQYTKDASAQKAMSFKPFKVASSRSRRRNRAIVGGIAVGVAALILSDAIRSSRRNDYYYSKDYYREPTYRYRSTYPSRSQCRKWARRCDYGTRRACRKWNRRCR